MLTLKEVSLNNNSGAVSALKGYRAQFIYSLARILAHRENENSFQPEGRFEDLDIYDTNGNLIEIIQVKNLGSTLTLSNVLTQANTSFLKRAVKAHGQGNSAKITLVSFGGVNDDIKELGSDRFSAGLKGKLKQFGLSAEQVEVLRQHFTYEIVNEDALTTNTVKLLEDLRIYADTKISMDLLVYWIYVTAMQQRRIERGALQGQLMAIGKFQSDRVSFNNAYGTLIRPLTLNDEGRDTKKLQADFYQGIAASYNHILAGIDVVRPEKLEMISQKFTQSNTVFVHGASGQGKSTIAYRYLHDYCETHTAFVLSPPTDLTSLYQVVNTLDAMATGVLFPITLFIDVVHGNRDWIVVLQELASKTKIKFLVTIREEDWNSIQIDDKFTFAELELGLDKHEAQIIYKSLGEFHVDLRYTDFQEAWDAFGESGPLLEFVYLITQGESLPAKLKSQVDGILDDGSALAKDKIKLLRFVVLADCYGARVTYRDIAQYLNLDNIARLTELLEREYLLKLSEGKTFITGLHPVRSNLLRGFLFDAEIHNESDFALESLHFLDHETLAVFLRHAFRYAAVTPASLLTKLSGVRTASWVFYDSVLRTLIWKGVSDFIDQNREVLRRALTKFGRGWIAIVNIDLGKALEGEDLTSIWSLFSDQQRAEAKDINSNLNGEGEIYKYCISWISSFKTISIDPITEGDFKALASFVFWVERLKLDVGISISTQSIEKGFKTHSLEVLCKSLHAFKIYKKLFDLRNSASDIFLDRFYPANNVINLTETADEVHCDYFFNFLDGEDYKASSNFIHAKSMRIIEQLRFAYPGKEIYATDGHGHKFSFIPDMHDESHKRIPRKNLPLDYLVEINSLFINLFDYENRFDTWEEYIAQVVERRLLQVSILEKSITAFAFYHKKKNYGPLIDFVQNFRDVLAPQLDQIAIPAFPKILFDEWGLSGEGKRENAGAPSNIESKTKDQRKALSLRRYEYFRKVYQEYDSSITNYLGQSAQTITHLILARTGQKTEDTNDASRISLVGNLYKAFEVIEEFHRSFRTHFEKFNDRRVLDNLESRERSCVSALCFIYRHFIYSTSFLPGNIVKTAHGHLDQVVISFQSRMNSGIKALGRELGCRFTVHRDVHERRLVILAWTESSMVIYSMLERLYNLFHHILDNADATSVKHAVLSKYFESIFVIPMMGDHSLNGKWYEFKFYNLVDKEFQALVQFNLIPQDIPETIRLQHSIHSWNSTLPEFVKLDDMLGGVSSASQLLYHYHQFFSFSGVEIEMRGENVLTAYLSRVSASIHENLQKGLDLFHYFRIACEEGKFEFENDQEKEELEEYLLSTRLNFFVSDDDAEQGGVERPIGTGEMEEWLPRLQKLNENIGVIYLFLSGKIVANHRRVPNS